MTGKRKLIEVALPLEAINTASVANKNRKVGTIKNAHKWFAPMPLPALRALMFAALVDDPEDDEQRAELLQLVEQLVPANGTEPSAAVLLKAKTAIARCNPELPVVLEPFAGGGSTLVEAQRLGLPCVGGDLNPVAVLITRCLTETLPPVAQVKPVGVSPEALDLSLPYAGITADIKAYGQRVLEYTQQQVGDAYAHSGKGELVAWLWARTIPCPNPACGVVVPLFGSPQLNKVKGREQLLSIRVEGQRVIFGLADRVGPTTRATKVAGRARFECPSCGTGLGEREIRAAGMGKALGIQLMTTCVDQDGLRTFRAPQPEDEHIAVVRPPDDLDEIPVGENTRDFRTGLYGLTHHTQLHTARQLLLLSALAGGVSAVQGWAEADGASPEHARAIATVLGLCVGKMAQSNSALVRWRIDSRNGAAKAEPAFGTQAVPMLWDFAEANPFGRSVGSWRAQIDAFIALLPSLPTPAEPARVVQQDARTVASLIRGRRAMLVTDPPYFGQINYAHLSDHFYPWLRRSLRKVHPDLFATIATPKDTELVADPVRHGGSTATAKEYFVEGFTEVFSSLSRELASDLPLLVAYAQKQAEEEVDGAVSTGWEALLESVLRANLSVVGTWPIAGTAGTRQIGQGANALASYIILVCRPRPSTAQTTSRRQFIAALKAELPSCLRTLQQASVPPIDLAQAAIGPGMEVFSRYAKVVEANGSAMTVRTALALINHALDEVLSEQEGDFDADTRFALKWFSQFGFSHGASGDADQLARSTNSSVGGVIDGGIFWARQGTARLLGPDELSPGWDPMLDDRISQWEVTVRLARAVATDGVDAAAPLYVASGTRVDLEACKELSYLLFSVCERKKWADVGALFNALGSSWLDLEHAARGAAGRDVPTQGALDYDDEA